MTDEEIHQLMWDYFGLTADPTWPRQRLLDELVKRATEIVDVY
jgi:hypothetical protein